MFGKLKERIANEMDSYEEKRAFEVEEVKNGQESDVFLKNIKTLSELIYPYKDPSNFNRFREYSSMDEINFSTRESSITYGELVRITGLSTLRYSGGWDEDKWEASYKEYKSLFNSSDSNTARSMQVGLTSIHSKIKENKGEYSNFVIKYSDTLSNIIEVINQYGIKFILEDGDIFNKIKHLIGSFAQDYDNYTGAIKEYKKAQILEKLDIEQKFVDKMIEDSNMLLEFSQK